ncbi:MAG: hypothetical protein JJU06_20130 [Ectothiorhodospiraceae bacterium]|nr:hypothetical protein [Ectothiorhodospiraceae bacterium]MCH8503426.1 hypothetical protein [Ectothiorhodospiraceae bacterium]
MRAGNRGGLKLDCGTIAPRDFPTKQTDNIEYFSYDPEAQRIFFRGLGEKDLVTVPEDSRRLSSRILNPRPGADLTLKFVDGHFVRVE